MEFIKELGSLALGSRLKNLSDILMRDVAKVYREQDVNFEPRWFPFFQLLIRKGEISVTQIANNLNQTHPSVVQVIKVLERKNLVITKKDKTDNRKRLVRLSSKGKKLVTELEPLWIIIQETANEILDESIPDLLDKMIEVEKAIQRKSTYHRIQERIIQKMTEEMRFADYHKKYHTAFQQLNEDWLSTYLDLSEHDVNILTDPEHEIIHKNGNIFLLITNEKVIGTYAIQRINENKCELSKFTIRKEFRGQKLGKKMLFHAIEKARELKCKSIVLFTHHKLIEATDLYKKNGFEIFPDHPELKDKTGRCSLYMQLNL